MFNDRRRFIVSTGMAAGATMLGQLSADEKFPEGGTAEDDVAHLISRFGKVRKVAKTPSGVIQVSATVRNHGRMARILTEQGKLPIGRIKVNANNSMEFTHRGERFSISHQV